MNKVLFNRQYGLLASVLNGRKIMTRRICINQINPTVSEAKWRIGEIVAVAQSYKEIGLSDMCNCPGYFNSMFVKASVMPHKIEILDVKVERLKDISNEDCIKEGVLRGKFRGYPHDMFYPYSGCKDIDVCWTSRHAFSLLIDKVSGKGTWERNPYVFVYTFKLLH